MDLDLDITTTISAHYHRSFYLSLLCKSPLKLSVICLFFSSLLLPFWNSSEHALTHVHACTRRSVCVYVHARVANTTWEACNWVCPPTTWQYRQWNRRLHCPRHNGYIRPSHPFIYWAAESHHSVAAVEFVVCPMTATSEVICTGLYWSLYDKGEGLVSINQSDTTQQHGEGSKIILF